MVSTTKYGIDDFSETEDSFLQSVYLHFPEGAKVRLIPSTDTDIFMKATGLSMHSSGVVVSHCFNNRVAVSWEIDGHSLLLPTPLICLELSDTQSLNNRETLRDLLGRGAKNSELPGDTTVTDETTSSLQEVLANRRATHGDFGQHALITQRLKDAAKQGANWYKLSPAQKESVDMILHKIGRILSGDPNHADHWIDICGYSKLISDCLTKEQKDEPDF